MTLPLFIHENNRILMALLCGVAFFLGYSIPNHYHMFPPQQLVLTEWDKAVPFIPWTILVYTSEYLLFVTAYIAFKEDFNRNRYIWCYFGVLFVGMLAFIFFPTTYPRADYPIPRDTSALVLHVFNTLRMFDDPSNCFPSMHVTCCFITAFSFLPKTESRRTFWIYFFWSVAVALSTLPTKQHYIADVMGGFMLSVAGYWFFFKKARYVPLPEYVERFRTKFSRVES